MKNNKIIFGFHSIINTIQTGKAIDKILIRQDLQSNMSRELLQIIKKNNISVQRVPKESLNRFTNKNHQGVIAFISEILYHKLENIVPMLYENGKIPLIILLDGVTDVRNFGAIARTCSCAGVDALVIPTFGSAGICADSIKTSSGALMSLPVCREKTIVDAINFLKTSGYQTYASIEKAKNYYTQFDYNTPTAIVLGSEESGISSRVLGICNHVVKIPVCGTVTSLNVSVAASIIIYEVIRQRNKRY